MPTPAVLTFAAVPRAASPARREAPIAVEHAAHPGVADAARTAAGDALSPLLARPSVSAAALPAMLQMSLSDARVAQNLHAAVLHLASA